MEIRIRRIMTEDANGDGSDVTTTYSVLDNGREFLITLRTHRHGGNLGLAGREGFLYSDKEANTVHRQVLSVGKLCGIVIEADEVVEGLSPPALRGVVTAHRSGEMEEIRITDDGLRRCV
jgi:hypothetical protein